MSKQKLPIPSRAAGLRPHTGPSQGVRIRREANADVIEVATSTLPVPSRSIVANWGAVVLDGTDISIIFGQKLPTVKRLVAALVVSISRNSLRQFYENSSDFVESYRRHAENNRMPAAQISEPSEDILPERVVFERASIIGTAYMDSEAEFRFYMTSASDYQALKAGQSAEFFFPVVRVLLPTQLYRPMMDRLLELAEDQGEP